ncbi:hypothetical protein ACSBR1_022715 [Camellia fascicularis]
MDPEAAKNHLLKARLFAVKFIQKLDKIECSTKFLENLIIVFVCRYLLGALYTVIPVDFFPAGRLDAIDVFNYFAIALIFILYIVGLYYRRQRLQHVRQLATDHP